LDIRTASVASHWGKRGRVVVVAAFEGGYRDAREGARQTRIVSWEELNWGGENSAFYEAERLAMGRVLAHSRGMTAIQARSGYMPRPGHLPVIDADVLASEFACPRGLARFRRAFPKGVTNDVSGWTALFAAHARIRAASHRDGDLEWLAGRFGTPEILAQVEGGQALVDWMVHRRG
jgi:hypothetical protein